MATQPDLQLESAYPTLLIRDLHRIVTRAPRDLRVIAVMRPFGYNEFKWAEGQCLLAELVAVETPNPATLAAAAKWYQEVARTACDALDGEPSLLARLGLPGRSGDDN